MELGGDMMRHVVLITVSENKCTIIYACSNLVSASLSVPHNLNKMMEGNKKEVMEGRSDG